MAVMHKTLVATAKMCCQGTLFMFTDAGVYKTHETLTPENRSQNAGMWENIHKYMWKR